MSSHRDEVEALLLHDGYVRRLARCLTLDAAAGDDLAQETLLVALEHPHGPRWSLREWLRGVARRLAQKQARGDGRRRRREATAARAELQAGSSPLEILERESARRALVDAVLALQEPYRQTIVLRFFDNLPPRRVATRLGVPVATVHSRTKRALEQLRGRLAPTRSWQALLLLARLPPAVPSATSTLALVSVITMSTNGKLALFAAAMLGTLALALYSFGVVPGGIVPDAGTEARRAAPLSSVLPQAAASSTTSSQEIAREPVAASRAQAQTAPAADRPGSLALRVVWARDQTPAADVGVWVVERARPNPFVTHREGRSDRDGEVRFDRILPGDVTILLDRSGSRELQSAVRPGEEKRITVEVPTGYDVYGLVVDPDGAPVAGAEAWLSDALLQFEGHVVARSGADGRFVLRSVSGRHAIRARSDDHAPSQLTDVQGTEDSLVEIRLVLGGPAGEVRGTVLDPAGAPVPDALVLVGTKGFDEGQCPPRFRTDVRGRFCAVGIAAGTSEVCVRAEPFVLWRGPVEVRPHEASDLEVRLLEGATLVGTVRTSDGAPVSGAWIGSGYYGLLGVTTKSGKDGAYRLVGLPAGELALGLESEGLGHARTKLMATPGAELRWDPVLPLGLSLHGRVVDELGQPVAKWWVQIDDQDPQAGERDSDVVATAADGSFHFASLHDREHVLTATPQGEPAFFAKTRLEHARPGQREIVLHARATSRSVRIVGTLLDAEGKPGAAATLCPSEPTLESHGTVLARPKAASGRFELGPYPPGDWSLKVLAPDAGELLLGPKLLRENETWDLGTIRIARPGSVAVRIDRAAGVAPEMKLDLRVTRQAKPVRCEFRREGEGEHLVSGPLPPGEYGLRVAGKAAASEVVAFEVAAGEPTEISVRVVPAAWCRLRAELQVPDPTLLHARLVVRTAQGRLAYDAMMGRRSLQGPFELALPLAPGTYAVAITTATGRRAQETLLVADQRNDEPAVPWILK